MARTRTRRRCYRNTPKPGSFFSITIVTKKPSEFEAVISAIAGGKKEDIPYYLRKIQASGYTTIDENNNKKAVSSVDKVLKSLIKGYTKENYDDIAANNVPVVLRHIILQYTQIDIYSINGSWFE